MKASKPANKEMDGITSRTIENNRNSVQEGVLSKQTIERFESPPARQTKTNRPSVEREGKTTIEYDDT